METGEGEELALELRAANKGSILVGVKHFPEPKDSWLSPSIEIMREKTPPLREFN